MTCKAYATLASLGLAVGGMLALPATAQSGDPAAPKVVRRPARPTPTAERRIRPVAARRGIEVRRSAAIDPRILAPGDPGIDPRIVAGWPGAGSAPLGPPVLPDVIPWIPR